MSRHRPHRLRTTAHRVIEKDGRLNVIAHLDASERIEQRIAEDGVPYWNMEARILSLSGENMSIITIEGLADSCFRDSELYPLKVGYDR